jgi:hypothetical protein
VVDKPIGPGRETVGEGVVVSDSQRLRYRVLTGPDDATFCERVSAALDEGYQLHGGPTLTFNGSDVIVGQALVLPTAPSVQPLLT